MPTEADRKLAEEFTKGMAYSNPVIIEACAEAISFARERFEADETAKQPPAEEPEPLPDWLPAHCFAVVECVEQLHDYDVYQQGQVFLFKKPKRTIPVPAGSVLFIPTGEVRPPKNGEWFLNFEGTVLQASCDFISQYPILHCIEVV